MNRSLQSIGASFDTVKTFAAGFFGAVGAQAIARFGKDILDFADDLATAADQAGVGVERFQTLREGFRALEIDSASFDKALKRLNSTLGDVQNGVEDEGTKALDKMGISARILTGEISTTDELLDAVAASAKNMGSQAQYTSALVDIFGRRVGVDMAAALKDGGDGLHELEDAFRQTGDVISKDYIDRLADANESLDAFTARAKARITIWAAEMIPQIEKVGLGFRNLGIQWDIANQKAILLRSYATPDQKQAALQRIADLRGEQVNIAEQRDTLNGKKPGGDIFGVGATLDAANDIAGRIGNSRNTSVSLASGSGSKKSKGGSGLSDAAKLTQQYEAQKKELEQALELQTMRIKGMEHEADLLEIQYGLQKQFPGLDQKRLNILYDQKRVILEQKEGWDELAASLERSGEGAQAWLEQWTKDQGSKELKSLLADLGIDTKTATDSMRRSWAETTDDILYSIDRLSNGIRNGGFLDLLSGVVGLFMQLGSAGAFGSKLATNINKPGARAHGGPVTGNRPYLVGERGPELFLPGASGRIVANDDLGRAVLPGVAGVNKTIAATVSSSMKVEVVKGDLFDVIVRREAAGVVASAAPSIASAGSQHAQKSLARQASRRLA